MPLFPGAQVRQGWQGAGELPGGATCLGDHGPLPPEPRKQAAATSPSDRREGKPPMRPQPQGPVCAGAAPNSLPGPLSPKKLHTVEDVLKLHLLIEPEDSVAKPNTAIKVKTQNHVLGVR